MLWSQNLEDQDVDGRISIFILEKKGGGGGVDWIHWLGIGAGSGLF
jgi:hypothetical protein